MHCSSKQEAFPWFEVTGGKGHKGPEASLTQLAEEKVKAAMALVVITEKVLVEFVDFHLDDRILVPLVYRVFRTGEATDMDSHPSSRILMSQVYHTEEK